MQSIILRTTTLILLLCLCLAYITQPVEAAKEWCRKDPVISVNGTIVHLYVLVPLENVRDVTAVTIEVSVPAGTSVRVISQNTFQGEPFDITFKEDPALIGTHTETPILATYTVHSEAEFKVAGQVTTDRITYSGEGVAKLPFLIGQATVYHSNKNKR